MDAVSLKDVHGDLIAIEKCHSEVGRVTVEFETNSESSFMEFGQIELKEFIAKLQKFVQPPEFRFAVSNGLRIHHKDVKVSIAGKEAQHAIAYEALWKGCKR